MRNIFIKNLSYMIAGISTDLSKSLNCEILKAMSKHGYILDENISTDELSKIGVIEVIGNIHTLIIDFIPICTWSYSFEELPKQNGSAFKCTFLLNFQEL